MVSTQHQACLVHNQRLCGGASSAAVSHFERRDFNRLECFERLKHQERPTRSTENNG